MTDITEDHIERFAAAAVDIYKDTYHAYLIQLRDIGEATYALPRYAREEMETKLISKIVPTDTAELFTILQDLPALFSEVYPYPHAVEFSLSGMLRANLISKVRDELRAFGDQIEKTYYADINRTIVVELFERCLDAVRTLMTANEPKAQLAAAIFSVRDFNKYGDEASLVMMLNDGELLVDLLKAKNAGKLAGELSEVIEFASKNRAHILQ